MRDTHNDGLLHVRDKKLFDDAIAPIVARCFLEPDQLAEALCEGAGPPAWVASVDPMQDELAAALVAIRQAAHQRLGAYRLRQPPLRRFKLCWWRLVLWQQLLGA